ncbi:MAG TPA: DNA ligase D [Nitrococcus sp.]|nr:DNA ligase D [Nitrococcus sp.]
MEKLKQYREKRDFQRTPEPTGEAPKDSDASGGLFVIQKHAARRLHFDLRLEQNGVLRSWALPKGPSLKPGEKRLAVQVEDHPLEYGDFEGVIPQQEYGGGTVMLWDRGHWTPKDNDNRADRLDFELEGQKLHGAWTLVRMSGRSNKDGVNWLLIKRTGGARHERAAALDDTDDKSVATGRTMEQIAHDRDRTWTAHGESSPAMPAPPDPARLDGAHQGPMPKALRPQLATLAQEVPKGVGWIHEIKFDGYRIIAQIEDGVVRLISRSAQDWTERFPELAALLDRLPVDRAMLDGEVVALAPGGTSSFRRLQEALSEGRTERLVYQAFDLLYLNDQDLVEVALLERKQALAELLAAAGFTGSTAVRYTDHLEAQGAAFFEQACRLGLEGIVSKRSNSRYRSGRTKQWLKVKCTHQEEFVVGGYTNPGGTRSGFGALLLGAYRDGGELSYTGRVGTGFSARQLTALHATLRQLARPTKPFHGSVPNSRGAHWVQPQLVVEVEFSEWTRDGRLRQPAFRGVREDRNPAEIRLTEGKRSPDRTARTTAPRTTDTAARYTRSAAGKAQVAGVRLTNPQRILYPEQGVTKLALAHYYEAIQDWILPHLANRPLSLVRCPLGRNKQCFFQKHPHQAMAASIPRLAIKEKEGSATYLYVRSIADLVALVQAGVLEIHPWGSRVDDVEHPDLMVFDLDPAPEVAWPELLRVAVGLRDRLQALGLASFPRTTGGKGLHLVVPLARAASWAEAKAFARAVAEHQAHDEPRRLTANLSKAKRHGRIFLDYLRNGRGATAIASYSTRARAGAPVAVPIGWHELSSVLRSDRYNIENLGRRLAALRTDPWEGFDAARRPITRAMRQAVGLQ